jgi:hypothetical protein
MEAAGGPYIYIYSLHIGNKNNFRVTVVSALRRCTWTSIPPNMYRYSPERYCAFSSFSTID